MTIYQWYDVRLDYVEIKFLDTIDISTLVNDNFILKNVSVATPTVIPSAFKTIDLGRDYYSVSRTLRLYWAADLTTDTHYSITISNLKKISGAVIADDTILFDTDGVSIEIPTSIITEPPTHDPVDTENYSIKEVADIIFASSLTESTSGALSITSITPDLDHSWSMDASYNEGRIEIWFNQTIAANYISSTFFRVQRKAITSTMSKWEDLTTIVGSNSENKLVVIYLPSDDATPVYGEADKNYWLSGYKYRLKIMGTIGAA